MFAFAKQNTRINELKENFFAFIKVDRRELVTFAVG